MAGTWGLGTWSWFDSYWAHDKSSSPGKVFREALSLGASHVDTAPIYGNGRSEQFLGRLFRETSSSIEVGTKFQLTELGGVLKSLKRSLTRLGRKNVGVFYAHWPRKDRVSSIYAELLQDLKESREIGACGVSNFLPGDLENLGSLPHNWWYQGPLNPLFRRRWEDSLPWLRQTGSTFEAYGVLGQGLFSRNMEKTDGRLEQLLFRLENRPAVLQFLKEWKALCDSSGVTQAKLALRWAQAREKVGRVILGSRLQGQLAELFAGPEPSLKTLELAEGLSQEFSQAITFSQNLWNHS